MGTAGQPHQLTVYRLVEAGDFTKMASSQAETRTQSVVFSKALFALNVSTLQHCQTHWQRGAKRMTEEGVRCFRKGFNPKIN